MLSKLSSTASAWAICWLKSDCGSGSGVNVSIAAGSGWANPSPAPDPTPPRPKTVVEVVLTTDLGVLPGEAARRRVVSGEAARRRVLSGGVGATETGVGAGGDEVVAEVVGGGRLLSASSPTTEAGRPRSSMAWPLVAALSTIVSIAGDAVGATSRVTSVVRSSWDSDASASPRLPVSASDWSASLAAPSTVDARQVEHEVVEIVVAVDHVRNRRPDPASRGRSPASGSPKSGTYSSIGVQHPPGR